MAVVAASLTFQIALTLVTVLFPGEGGAYGAPIPVGAWSGMLFLGARADVSWPLFAANVALTAAVFWLLARRSGGVLLMTLGSLLFLAVAVAMYIGMRAGLPFAGVPIPISFHDPVTDRPRVALLALWIDCLVGAALPTAWIAARSRRGATAG